MMTALAQSQTDLSLHGADDHGADDHGPGLRAPETLMRLDRLGAAFPTRLSFKHLLLRNLARDGSQVSRPHWDMNDLGHGTGVYSLNFGGHTYSLIAVSTPLKDQDRSDRVIAQAWDAAFVLYDGLPTKSEIARLAASAPKQEGARFTQRELTLSRANKSVRLFEEVAAALARGQQPDAARLDKIGYLMRTTAVYGNGKFGIADRDCFAARPGMSAPFQAEMLTVWLIRAFTFDLVDHVAACRSPSTAVKLAPPLRRHLGIGNATGLGMAPFLVSHPDLLHAWVWVRETALQRILATGPMTPQGQERLQAYGRQIERHLSSWNVEDQRQMQRIQTLRQEFAALDFSAPTAHDLWNSVQTNSLECQELLQAMLIDLHPDLVDDLTEHLAPKTPHVWRPQDRVADLRTLIEGAYGWALSYDFTAPEQQALFWYTSEEKLEPRLGRRAEEPGADLERPLDIGRQVQRLHQALLTADPGQQLAFFLADHSDLRAIAGRIQTCASLPYAEIHDNLIADTCLPIDMLRFKLAMFGAHKFDPKSDLWTRITLFQGAPLINETRGQDWGFATL